MNAVYGWTRKKSKHHPRPGEGRRRRQREARQTLAAAPAGDVLRFIRNAGGEAVLDRPTRDALRKSGVGRDALDAGLTVLHARRLITLSIVAQTIRVRLAVTGEGTR